MPGPMQTARTKSTGTVPAPSSGSISSLTDPLTDPLAATSVAPTDGGDTRGKDGTVAGKQSWESTLGSFVGGGVYKLVAPHLTEAALGGYAQKGVDAAMGQLRDFLKGKVGATAEDAANALTKALESQVTTGVKDFMGGEGAGAAAAIAEFVDDSPITILTAALAGAAAYVLTNQPLPEIPVKLGGLKVTAALGGGIMDLISGFDITVDKLKAEYSAGSVKMKADYASSTDDAGSRVDKLSGSFLHSSTDDDKIERSRLEASGSLLAKDGKLGGWDSKLAGKLALGDPNSLHTLTGSLSGGQKGNKDFLKANAGYRFKSPTLTGGADLSYARTGGKDLTTLSGDLAYDTDRLDLSGKGSLSSDGAYSLEGMGKYQFNKDSSIYGKAFHKNEMGAAGMGMQRSTGAELGAQFKKDRWSVGGGVGVQNINGQTSGFGQIKAAFSF